jgi:hypothetical protein
MTPVAFKLRIDRTAQKLKRDFVASRGVSFNNMTASSLGPTHILLTSFGTAVGHFSHSLRLACVQPRVRAWVVMTIQALPNYTKAIGEPGIPGWQGRVYMIF